MMSTGVNVAETRKVLVTGGAGYIGSHVCRALAAAGYQPLALDDLSNGARRAARFGPLHSFDFGDEVQLGRLLDAEPVWAVIHLAGLTDQPASFAQPLAYYEANVIGTSRLLAAMVERGIPRLIFASSAAIYGDLGKAMPAAGIPESRPAEAGSPFARSKVAIEQLLESTAADVGLHYLSFRLFTAAGADPDSGLGEDHREATHLIPLAIRAAAGDGPAVTLQGTDFPTPDGTAIRDYVHVSDLAEAHLRGLDYLASGAPSRSLNLGAGQGVSVRQVLDQVARTCGRPVPTTPGPRRPGEAAVLVADIAEARRHLGWQPQRSDLRTIVETAAAWETGGRKKT
jgi:UDP-glucose-4-epimerase GalE